MMMGKFHVHAQFFDYICIQLIPSMTLAIDTYLIKLIIKCYVS